MNYRTKIDCICTVVGVGIVFLVTILTAIVTYFCLCHAGIGNFRILSFLLSLLLIISISGIGVYLLVRKFSFRIIERIDDAARYSEKTFISSASHELNNPLTAIQGECEITLLKERTSVEYQIALRRIESETIRIIQLMKQLLFLSYGDKEILNNTVEQIPLADFLMQFVQSRVSFSPDSFAFIVEANPNMLKIAIGNIISNALKYSEKKVEIRLYSNTLEVKDYGIGIPEEELKHIAQPFYRAANAREVGGNGIGLSLSIRILNVYGAKITILSTPGKETCIKIEFP